MKVVLLKKQDKLGEPGSVVDVKKGYAINYLIPQEIAAIGTKEKIELAKKSIVLKKEEKKQIEKKVHETSKRVQNKKFKMSVKTSSGGRTYAAISKEEVEKLIEDSINKKSGGVKVEVDLAQPIKEVGKYSLDVILKSPDKQEKSEIILDIVSE
ncbi:MAG: 50S ribosomal protein L9 [bacterium]